LLDAAEARADRVGAQPWRDRIRGARARLSPNATGCQDRVRDTASR
jgi:hypothetical protein